MVGNLAGRESIGCADQGHDGAIGFIERDRGHLRGAQGHAEADPDLFQHRGGEPGVAARGDHALHAAAPLLDQAELVEHPADHPVSQLRDTEGQVGHGQAKGQQAGILDFQPVVERRDADRCASLGIVAVRHRVDHGLAHGHGRQGPVLAAPQPPDLRAMGRVLFHEGDGLFDGLQQ